jgi:mono/diheme cytochrome c family protein
VAVLLVAVPVLDRLFTRIPERTAIVVASAFVAHEAWHWTQERYAVLDSYPLTMPVFDVSLAVLIVRALMALLVLVGALWAVQGLMARLQPRPLVSGGAPGARNGVVAVLLLAAVAGLVPMRAEAQPRTTMAGVYTTEQATKGREVFTSNCLGCHTTATHMGPAFQNKWFGRPLFDLYDYVSQAMPKAAPGSLTEDEYVWVTAYILRLNGMPAGRTELNPEPAWLKGVKVDSTLRAVGSPKQVAPLSRTPSLPLFSLVPRPRARTENP